jgi:hypothetical protein
VGSLSAGKFHSALPGGMELTQTHTLRSPVLAWIHLEGGILSSGVLATHIKGGILFRERGAWLAALPGDSLAAACVLEEGFEALRGGPARGGFL